MQSEEEVKKSASKWAIFYGIRKDEVAQKDVADLLNKYNVSDEDVGRLSAAMQVLATKDIVRRGGMKGWR